MGLLKAAGVSTCVTSPGPSRLDGHVPCKSYPNTSRDRDGKASGEGWLVPSQQFAPEIGLPKTKLISQPQCFRYYVCFRKGTCWKLVKKIVEAANSSFFFFWGGGVAKLTSYQTATCCHSSEMNH